MSRFLMWTCIVIVLFLQTPVQAGELVVVGRTSDLDLLESFIPKETKVKRLEIPADQMRTKLAIMVGANMEADLIVGPYPILRNLAVPGALVELNALPSIRRRLEAKASDDVMRLGYREVLLYRGRVYGILLKDSLALDQRLFVAMFPTTKKASDVGKILDWIADRVKKVAPTADAARVVAENYLRDFYAEKDYETAFFYLARATLKEYWDWGWISKPQYLAWARDSFFDGVPVVSIRVGQPARLAQWSPVPKKAFKDVWEVPYILGYNTTGGVVERPDKLHLVVDYAKDWSVVLSMPANAQ